MVSAWFKFALVLASVWLLGGPWGLVILGGLLVVVLGHEIGHLVAAKAAGCVASDLSVGFGPVVLQRRGRRRWYRLRAYPLGGFVKLQPDDGFEGVPMDAMSPLRRFGIAVAGPIGSFASAFVLLLVLFVGTGVNLPGTSVAADGAGLLQGDVLVAVDGVPVDNAAPLFSDTDVTAVVLRGGAETTVEIPAVKKLEIRMSSEATRIPLMRSIPLAGEITVEAVGASVRSIAAVPRSLLGFVNPQQPRDVTERPSSLVSVFQSGSDFSETFGPSGMLFLIAQLSIILGVFNLLPVPPLDGGHAAIAVVEGVGSKIMRRPVRVPEAVVVRATIVVLTLLVGLSVMAIAMDLLFPRI